MVSSRPPRSFEEFVASQGMGVPPMKGVTPAGRALPQTSSGYDANATYRPTMVPNGEGGYRYDSGTTSNPCGQGYVFIDGQCVSLYGAQDGLPMPDPAKYGPAAGCPVGYQVIDGRCMYAP